MVNMSKIQVGDVLLLHDGRELNVESVVKTDGLFPFTVSGYLSDGEEKNISYDCDGHFNLSKEHPLDVECVLPYSCILAPAIKIKSTTFGVL